MPVRMTAAQLSKPAPRPALDPPAEAAPEPARPGRGFAHESSASESKEWYTPPSIYDWLREAGLGGPAGALGTEPMFDLDPCSPGPSTIHWSPAKHHLTSKEDGLKTPWSGPAVPSGGKTYGRVFLNMPYNSKTNGIWLQKFVEHGAGIALLFARTDARWFHEWALRCDGLFFIKGRVKFITPAEAPFVPVAGTGGAASVLQALAGKEPPPPGGGPGSGSMFLSCGPVCTRALQKLDELGRGVFLSL